MKLTNKQLKQIIKEEIEALFLETDMPQNVSQEESQCNGKVYYDLAYDYFWDNKQDMFDDETSIDSFLSNGEYKGDTDSILKYFNYYIENPDIKVPSKEAFEACLDDYVKKNK